MLCVHAKLLQSCLTLCDSMDCSMPSSSVHGILQARIQKWIAMTSPKGSFNPGIKPFLISLALAGRFFATSATWEAQWSIQQNLKMYNRIHIKSCLSSHDSTGSMRRQAGLKNNF